MVSAEKLINELNNKKPVKKQKISKKSVKKLDKIETYVPKINGNPLLRRIDNLDKKLDVVNDEIKNNQINPEGKKNIIKSNIDKLKKISLLDKDDISTLKEFSGKVLVSGVTLNFAMFVISKGFFEFNYYTWLGWGIAFHFIKKDFVNMVRSMWVK